MRPLRAAERVSTLQINLGLYCNLACKHCHVASSPTKTGDHENMSVSTATRIIEWLTNVRGIEVLDLTGGSPEANSQFRRIVSEARRLGLRVIDRCNPTIIGFTDPMGAKYDWIPQFLADHTVCVVASLPCYLEDNVREQRGLGAFEGSIQGLRALNAVGYGTDPTLPLNLVYNPVGPHLPPSAEQLSEAYHRELESRYGIRFNELWTITNMPIKRWREDLQRRGELDRYMQLLSDSFNPQTVDRLMCRHQIHIDSQGDVFDCDFNYALAMPSPTARGTEDLGALVRRPCFPLDRYR